MNSVLILVYTMSLLVVTGKGSNPLARTIVFCSTKVLSEGGLFLFWGQEEMEEEEEQSNQYKETSRRRKL